jgi:hypothetical protein
MPGRSFKFPLALLVKQAGRLQNALNDATIGPPVVSRLAAGFVPAFSTLLEKVSGAPAGTPSHVGDVGTLTQEQNDAFHEMLRLMAGARRTAGLAFKGNSVVLHNEFQVGIHEPQGLGDEVARAKIILAACQKYSAQLAVEGWTAQEATDLDTAIGGLSGIDLQQEETKDAGPGQTAVNIVDANLLYKNCLTIQNAGRLQFPSTKDGNETPRARYLIGEFPPHGHDDTGSTPPTPPAAPK